MVWDETFDFDAEIKELQEQMKSSKVLETLEVGNIAIKAMSNSEIEITASIVCPICKTKIKKCKYRDNKKGWTLSNFYRHVKQTIRRQAKKDHCYIRVLQRSNCIGTSNGRWSSGFCGFSPKRKYSAFIQIALKLM